MIAADQARELLHRNQPMEAAQLLREHLAGRTGSTAEQMLLGVALAQTGEVDAAIQALEQAVRLAPEHAAAHFNLGQVYLQAERPHDALRAFDRGLELRPDHAAAVAAAAELRGQTASEVPTPAPPQHAALVSAVEPPHSSSGPSLDLPRGWVRKPTPDGSLRVRDVRWNVIKLAGYALFAAFLAVGMLYCYGALHTMESGGAFSASGAVILLFALKSLGLSVIFLWEGAPEEWHVGPGVLEVRRSLLGYSRVRR